ncbi:MAG: hypothetical protein AAF824_14375 [Bacteroidota bacterium]
MKHIEYVYLAGSFMLLVFLVTEFKHLTSTTIGALLVAMVIFGFMYSFRRNQRIKFERWREEEIRKLEEEEDMSGYTKT